MGVLNQIVDEYHAANHIYDSEKLQWEIKVFANDKIDFPFIESVPRSRLPAKLGFIIDYVRSRKNALQWLVDNTGEYNKVLLRYRSGDLFQYHYLKQIKNKYFTVHHTMELPEAQSRPGVAGYIESRIENAVGSRVIEGAAGIIGVTNEIIDYELSRIKIPKPAYCLPNGILLENTPIVNDARSGIPKFIFSVSVVSPWHGIDILIDEVIRSNQNMELHIAGNIDKKYKVKDHRIIYHGLLDATELSDLASKCDVGLGTFAFHRIGMREGCTLKVRQYLAQGLPVYSGYVDSGLPSGFPYYHIGMPDVDKMIQFALDSRRFKRGEIRDAASQYIDKRIILRGLIDWLESL